MSKNIFDLSEYLAEVKAFKDAKRKPIADELQTLEKQIEDLTSRRDELQSILNAIDEVKPEPKRQIREKKQTANKQTGTNTPKTAKPTKTADLKAKILKAIGSEPIGRKEIAAKINVPADLALSKALGELDKEKLIKNNKGTGKGKRYFAK